MTNWRTPERSVFIALLQVSMTDWHTSVNEKQVCFRTDGTYALTVFRDSVTAHRKSNDILPAGFVE
jgi:hypothetical protein